MARIYFSEKGLEWPEEERIRKLYGLASWLIGVGSDKSLQLGSAKIEGKVFYWKKDGGYLAIDPYCQVIFCVKDDLRKVGFFYGEFLEHADEIVLALDKMLFNYQKELQLQKAKSS